MKQFIFIKNQFLPLTVLLVIMVLFSQCATSSNKNKMNSSQSETSEITCPKCGHTKTETLPTDVCTIRYTCENCANEMTPKEGDCCVYCSYGTHKCPSKQEN